jgi:L-cystine transport system permease protein
MRPFDPSYILEGILRLSPFIGTTLLVTFLSVLCGMILGVVVAWGRHAKFRIIRATALAYVHIIRCSPSLVLLFIVYYGVPAVFKAVTGIRTGYDGKLLYVTITLSLLFSAAMGELFRSVYDSVDQGQTDAAYCCGFTSFQTAWLIIIPQAAAPAIPVFCNEVIALMKQGALAFTIGFIDLMGETDVIIARRYGAHGLETYISLALIYWAVALCVERISAIVSWYTMRGKSVPGGDRNTWN